MTWIQPKNQDELLARLADARDLAVSERERENLCACAYTEIMRLQKETLDLYAAGCSESERADAAEKRQCITCISVLNANKDLKQEVAILEEELTEMRRANGQFGVGA